MPFGMRMERTLRTWGFPDRAARLLARPFRARTRARIAGTSPESSGPIRKR